jgi:hypothetical protein
MCVAPFDGDVYLEEVNVVGHTLFNIFFLPLTLWGGGGAQNTLMRACAPIYFHPVYFVCVQIMGSFLSSFILDTGLMLHLLLRSQMGNACYRTKTETWCPLCNI